MPNISYDFMTKWSNYHRTFVGSYATEGTSGNSVKNGEIRQIANIFCSDIADLSGPERFAATATEFYQFIKDALEGRKGLFMMEPAEAAVIVGRGWSFSNLCVARDLQLDLTGLSGMKLAQPDNMHENSTLDPSYIALVSGGTRLRELVQWAKPKNRSIRTSGSHLGPTIAGGFATASHGSRLGFGGLQDMILGMHIITGKNSSVWIEKRSQPVLNETTALSFATRIERDDAMFEDALIHLGGMGIVNGVAFELVDNIGYDRLAVNHPVGSVWLDQISCGEFRDIARDLGHDCKPVFYEATIDPQGYDGAIALHTMYFEGNPPPANEYNLEINRPADVIATFQTNPEAVLNALFPFGLENPLSGGENDASRADPHFPPIIQIYASPRDQGGFFDYTVLPLPTNLPGSSWDALHGGEITGGVPGALYNASYAMKRCDLKSAIPALCKIIQENNMLQTFLFTIRFVSDASGTLRFTRFNECAVIEIDGISRKSPILAEAGAVIEAAASLVRQALDAKGIDYSMHWGKLGGLDKAKVQADFGPAANAASPIGRWRATRKALLDDEVLGLFWNDALYDYGLLDSSPAAT
jgi:FAD binding domain